jgi:hypothetical protein
MQAFGDGHPLQGLKDPDFALDGDFLPYGFIMMSSLLLCGFDHPEYANDDSHGR